MNVLSAYLESMLKALKEREEMNTVKVLSTKEACTILRDAGIPIDPQKLGLGLQQRVFPFGIAIKAREWSYQIYERQLREWIAERTDVS